MLHQRLVARNVKSVRPHQLHLLIFISIFKLAAFFEVKYGATSRNEQADRPSPTSTAATGAEDQVAVEAVLERALDFQACRARARLGTVEGTWCDTSVGFSKNYGTEQFNAYEPSIRPRRNPVYSDFLILYCVPIFLVGVAHFPSVVSY